MRLPDLSLVAVVWTSVPPLQINFLGLNSVLSASISYPWRHASAHPCFGSVSDPSSSVLPSFWRLEWCRCSNQRSVLVVEFWIYTNKTLLRLVLVRMIKCACFDRLITEFLSSFLLSSWNNRLHFYRSSSFCLLFFCLHGAIDFIFSNPLHSVFFSSVFLEQSTLFPPSPLQT